MLHLLHVTLRAGPRLSLLAKSGTRTWLDTQISLTEYKNRAAHLVLNLKGVCSVSDAKFALLLDPLKKRWKRSRSKLIVALLDRDSHQFTAGSFESIIASCSTVSAYDARSVTMARPYVFSTDSTLFYNSFVPRTSWDIRSTMLQTGLMFLPFLWKSPGSLPKQTNFCARNIC